MVEVGAAVREDAQSVVPGTRAGGTGPRPRVSHPQTGPAGCHTTMSSAT